MRHLKPTLRNTAAIVLAILLIAMVTTTLVLNSRLNTSLEQEKTREAREDSTEQVNLHGGCVAGNARTEALIARFKALSMAEQNNTIGDDRVIAARITAYEGLANDLSMLIRDCNKVYPLPKKDL